MKKSVMMISPIVLYAIGTIVLFIGNDSIEAKIFSLAVVTTGVYWFSKSTK